MGRPDGCARDVEDCVVIARAASLIALLYLLGFVFFATHRQGLESIDPLLGALGLPLQLVDILCNAVKLVDDLPAQ